MTIQLQYGQKRSLTARRLHSSDDFSSGCYYFPQTTLIPDDFLPQKIYVTFQVPWRLKLMMTSFCSVFSSPSFRKYCCSSLGFLLLLHDDFSCMSCSTYTELLRHISNIQRCVHMMTSAQDAIPFPRRLQLWQFTSSNNFFYLAGPMTTSTDDEMTSIYTQ